jgi:hypothetical protein
VVALSIDLDFRHTVQLLGELDIELIHYIYDNAIPARKSENSTIADLILRIN